MMSFSNLDPSEVAAAGAAAVQSLPAWVGVAAVGLVLLCFGRRLYWLLLGAVGFALGFGLLSGLVASASEMAPLIAGLVGGLLGVLAAFFVQGALLAVVGAVLGALGALMVVSMWGNPSSAVLLVVTIIGAVIGAIVLRKLFFAGLILATSVGGAGILLQALSQLLLEGVNGPGLGAWPAWLSELAFPGPSRTLAFVLLAAVGVFVQTRGGGGRKQRDSKRTEQRLKREGRRLEKEAKRMRKAAS